MAPKGGKTTRRARGRPAPGGVGRGAKPPPESDTLPTTSGTPAARGGRGVVPQFQPPVATGLGLDQDEDDEDDEELSRVLKASQTKSTKPKAGAVPRNVATQASESEGYKVPKTPASKLSKPFKTPATKALETPIPLPGYVGSPITSANAPPAGRSVPRITQASPSNVAPPSAQAASRRVHVDQHVAPPATILQPIMEQQAEEAEEDVEMSEDMGQDAEVEGSSTKKPDKRPLEERMPTRFAGETRADFIAAITSASANTRIVMPRRIISNASATPSNVSEDAEAMFVDDQEEGDVQEEASPATKSTLTAAEKVELERQYPALMRTLDNKVRWHLFVFCSNVLLPYIIKSLGVPTDEVVFYKFMKYGGDSFKSYKSYFLNNTLTTWARGVGTSRPEVFRWDPKTMKSHFTEFIEPFVTKVTFNDVCSWISPYVDYEKSFGDKDGAGFFYWETFLITFGSMAICLVGREDAHNKPLELAYEQAMKDGDEEAQPPKLWKDLQFRQEMREVFDAFGCQEIFENIEFDSFVAVDPAMVPRRRRAGPDIQLAGQYTITNRPPPARRVAAIRSGAGVGKRTSSLPNPFAPVPNPFASSPHASPRASPRARTPALSPAPAGSPIRRAASSTVIRAPPIRRRPAQESFQQAMETQLTESTRTLQQAPVQQTPVQSTPRQPNIFSPEDLMEQRRQIDAQLASAGYSAPQQQQQVYGTPMPQYVGQQYQPSQWQPSYNMQQQTTGTEHVGAQFEPQEQYIGDDDGMQPQFQGEGHNIDPAMENPSNYPSPGQYPSQHGQGFDGTWDTDDIELARSMSQLSTTASSTASSTAEDTPTPARFFKK